MAAAGKGAELFELEMWLRSFERFFRIGAQPLSDREMRTLALRNWSEELRLVDNALMRVVHLATSILSEEQVDLTRFDRYVEASFARDEGLDPYIEKLVKHTTPEAALTLLRESFEDLHLLLVDLVRLSRLQYSTFHAVGKILYREVRRSDLVAMIIDKKFKPVHDRVAQPAHQPAGPRRRGPERAPAGGEGVPGAVPAAALPRVHGSRRACPRASCATRSCPSR